MEEMEQTESEAGGEKHQDNPANGADGAAETASGASKRGKTGQGKGSSPRRAQRAKNADPEARAERKRKPKAEKKAKSERKARSGSISSRIVEFARGFAEPIETALFEAEFCPQYSRELCLTDFDTCARARHKHLVKIGKAKGAMPESKIPEAQRIATQRRILLNRTMSGLRARGILVRKSGKGKDALWTLSAKARKKQEKAAEAPE
jgi:hypothetical protein